MHFYGKIDSKITLITSYYKQPTNNMLLGLPGNSLQLPGNSLGLPGNSLQLPGNSLQLPGNLQLPSRVTLESLYQINDQSICFLIWIFKKVRFGTDLFREALEAPFTVKRCNWPNGLIYRIQITKNSKIHGIFRIWHENGQLQYESHWKDDKKNGISRIWDDNGKLWWKNYWKYGTQISMNEIV